MATTSIWRINGQMGHVINYVENANKTTSPMEVPAGLSSDTLEDVIAYAGREDATNKRKLITGINLDCNDAKNQMMIVKKKFEKTGGTIAYHGYQSFAEGEVDPDIAHKIGVALAEELWGERFQVVVCTHLDKASHIHNHFVINTVSHIDGRKFYRSTKDYRKMREVSDRLCREYGLSVIQEPQRKGKHYGQYEAERKGKPTFGSTIRADIDRAIKASLTENEFYDMLEEMGYEFKFYSKNGKPLERPSLKPKNAQKYFRFDNLGEGYSVDEISDRILENIRRKDPFPEETKEKVQKYRKDYPPRPKAKGLAALYYYYCYELKIIVRYPASVKQVSFFMLEDIRKLEQLDKQVILLGENKIETYEDLKVFREKCSTEKAELMDLRHELRNKLKRMIRAGDEAAILSVKEEIATVTDELQKLNNDLVICDKVEERAERIQAEYTAIKEQQNEREENENELFRGCSRTNREDVAKRR
mgnify:CR=1 FL=1|jgi:hypothetical protein